MSELVVVVTGPPASGKTGPAKRLAEQLRVPFLGKDDLKETLYDTLGHGDDVEDALERAAHALLCRIAAVQLDAGVSVLLESDFNADTGPDEILRLVEDRDVRLVQVHMEGDTEVLVERFLERVREGERHPGHEDDEADAADLRAKLEAGYWAPLELPGELYRFDVSDKDAMPDEVARRLGPR